MKKITALLLSAAFVATTASAGSASVNVTINGVVSASCIFDNTTTAATFDYAAAEGTSNAMNGGATLYCNKGTVATVTTPAAGEITLRNGTNTLNSTYTLTRGSATVGSGTYAGADQYAFTLAVTAAQGQWSAPSGQYTGSLDINVTF